VHEPDVLVDLPDGVNESVGPPLLSRPNCRRMPNLPTIPLPDRAWLHRHAIHYVQTVIIGAQGRQFARWLNDYPYVGTSLSPTDCRP